MKIKEAEFVKGAATWSGLPADGRPEVAFIGRSNVGKSSLLNAVVGRRALARTSRTPGKTQQFNYYLINRRLYFVDLPGFGYAKVSRTERQRWGEFIGRFIAEREPLQLLIHLVDSRHPPTPLDRDVLELLKGSDVPYVIALTKADKLSGNDRFKTEKRMKDILMEYGIEAPVFLTSAHTKRGLPELLNWIDTMTNP
ncbi:MAG: ribosome biogenesis GTP-binding protein YihA/YsxC [Rhodothermales bacterium]